MIIWVFNLINHIYCNKFVNKIPESARKSACDKASGQCDCRDNIEGRRCDKCVENYYDLRAGCRECEPCYGLIQRRVNDYRRKLAELQKVVLR